MRRARLWAALGIVATIAVAGGCARSPLPVVGAPSAGRPPMAEGDAVPVEALAPSPAAEPSQPARAEPPRVEVGRPYVDFTVPLVAGNSLRLSEHVGAKVVLLQFWGVRCKPCLEEMSFLDDLQRQYAGALQVVGINTDRAPLDQLRKAMAGRGIAPEYPVAADPDFVASQSYTQWLVPVTALIDRRGAVRALHTGYNAQLSGVLRAEVEGLLSEER